MNTTKRKYGYGSSGVRNQYIEDPSTTLIKNDIMKAKAEQKASSNIGIPLTYLGANLLTSFMGSQSGQSMLGMNKGEEEGEAAMGADGTKPIDEVEGGEIIETPGGEVAEVKGPSHEEGGVDINMDKGTRVYSKRIEKFGETMAERKVKRENRKKNLDELIAKNPNDVAIKNTHSRTMSSLDKEEQGDLETQKLFGMLSALHHKFAYGTGNEGVDEDPNSVDKNKNGIPDILEHNDGIPDILRDNTYSVPSTKPAAEDTFNPESVIGRTAIPQKDIISADNETIDAEGFDFPTKNKSSFAGTLKKFKMPSKTDTLSTIGNGASLIGDVISTFGPMKNTLENRAGDTPNINPYKDFGKDAIDANLKAMEYAARTKDSTIQRITAQGRGIKRSNRNGARGINQVRALDTAVDINSSQSNQAAMDSFIKTMMELNNAKSGLENTQDFYVMQGNASRDINDRKDRDNFFTQKGKDIATMGEGIQHIGKDVNKIAENSMSTKMINQLSKYGIGFDKDGNLIDLRKAS